MLRRGFCIDSAKVPCTSSLMNRRCTSLLRRKLSLAWIAPSTTVGSTSVGSCESLNSQSRWRRCQLLLQVGHLGLAEAVDRDLVDPLRHPFAPVGAVGVEVALHLFPGHRVATVVAVADVVRAFQDRESHCGGRCSKNADTATGVGWQAFLQENSVLRGCCWSF